MNIRKSTIQRIILQDMHAFPHKIQTENGLTDQQKRQWLDFPIWFPENLEEDADFLKKLHIADECRAHLSGFTRN